MKRSVVSVVAVAGMALVGALAVAQVSSQPAKDPKPAAPAKPATQPAVQPAGKPPADAAQLPPGMSEADMQACMAAATPGEQHTHLAKGVGIWHGKSQMWMTPDAPAVPSECTSTVTSFMDGRFTKVEVAGEIPGMGPFNGFGINGYDNVAQKFQSTWIDNCGTGIMTGTGKLAADGKSMTWNYAFNCPITKKPANMRHVETYTGADTMTLQIFAAEPHSGKEYKMMETAFTRQAAKPTNTAR
ncbi:MAG: DUF1579 domain-containing protein [Phycisphaerales bacterium]